MGLAKQGGGGASEARGVAKQGGVGEARLAKQGVEKGG